MHIHQKHTLLAGCLTISILALSSGCRTGGFPKPDMNKLAFWKSENLMFASKKDNTPPPPARHFDPAPINGEDSQVVDLNPGKIKKRYDNDIDEMRAEISAAAKAVGTPKRKSPTAKTTLDANQFVADTKSTFEGTAEEMRGKLKRIESRANSELTDAQNDFQSAMQGTSNSIDIGLAAATKSATDLTQSWKDNTPSPGLTPTKSNSSLAAVNQSLNAATEKLTTSLHADADNAFKTGINAFGGSLKPMGTVAADQVNQFSNDAKQKVSEFADQANSFLPTPEAGRQVPAQSQRQQTELAEARRQIEELKLQLSEGKSSGTNAFATPSSDANSFGASTDNPGRTRQAISPPSTPGDRLANSNPPGFRSQYSTNTTADELPSNHLRSNSPLQPQFPPTSSGQAFSKPKYPSTSHNGFEPQANQLGGTFAPTPMPLPGNGAKLSSSQVDFQTGTTESNVVTANNAISPNASGSASRIASEIDLPASIRHGSGAYAPGSLRPLEPNK